MAPAHHMGKLFLVWILSLVFSSRLSGGLKNTANRQQEIEESFSSWIYNDNVTIDCAHLQMGQYYCEDPEIDLNTQQPKNCSNETRTSRVKCYPVPGINCSGEVHTGSSVCFYKAVPCKWTVAVLLSVFLGMFGVDRFYLGYPAIGLLKLCTLGFMFLGQLADILLIALQVVGPSDGSEYVIDYYGPGLTYVGRDNFTFIQPHY